MSANTHTENAYPDSFEGTRIQIFRYVAKDLLLDISDLLAYDPKRSKLAVALVEFDEQYRANQRVRHFVDADDCKLLCHDILHGLFTQFKDEKGNERDGRVEARVLTLSKETKYRQPFVLRVDNGDGEIYGSGLVRMVRVTDSLTVQMPEWEARRMALTVLDYVRQWEIIHFRKCQEARTVTFTRGGGQP